MKIIEDEMKEEDEYDEQHTPTNEEFKVNLKSDRSLK